MTDTEQNVVIMDKLDEILKILNGNGKIGLCAKVSILWGGSLFIVMSIVALAIKAFFMMGA